MICSIFQKNWTGVVAGLVLVAGGVTGCKATPGSGDAGRDAGSHDAGPMDAGPMDAGPMDAGNIVPTNCSEITLGDFEAPQDDGTAASYVAPSLPDTGDSSDPDLFALEFYGSGFDPSLNGEQTGTFDLSQGADDNYSTCSRCVLVRQDPNTPGKVFFQYSGTLDVDQSSDQLNGTLTATLTDVTLVEVTVDSTSFVSTPVDNGACLHIASANISIAPPSAPDGWNCDPTFYGDGECDCGCGVTDVDCADSTVASCDWCNDDGSCSTDTSTDSGCPGTIDSSDNSICTE